MMLALLALVTVIGATILSGVFGGVVGGLIAGALRMELDGLLVVYAGVALGGIAGFVGSFLYVVSTA